MLSVQPYRLDDLIFSQHRGDGQYLNAFLMDCWEQSRLFFERYRLPVLNIKRAVLSVYPQETGVVVERANEYIDRLNWLKGKFIEIGNSDIGYYVDWEIKRVEGIKEDLLQKSYSL